jgi:hypothetical protein
MVALWESSAQGVLENATRLTKKVIALCYLISISHRNATKIVYVDRRKSDFFSECYFFSGKVCLIGRNRVITAQVIFTPSILFFQFQSYSYLRK